MKHTPGPWIALQVGHNINITLDRPDRPPIAYIGGMDSPQAKANAQLIKTAPRLLHACHEALAWMDPETDGFSSHELRIWERETRELIAAVIKEAEAK